jgi:hypothetical protein
MKTAGGMRLKAASLLLHFSILSFYLGAPAHGEGLYTRTDALSCGSALVRAFTTCTVQTDKIRPAACTEQHFVFLDQTTGASVTVNGSGKIAGDARKGTRLWLDDLALDWACLKGKAGYYVVIGYGRTEPCGLWGELGLCGWDEVYDVHGRDLAIRNGAGMADDGAQNEKKWDSLGLPEPWPRDSFSPIQLLRKDREFVVSAESACEEKDGTPSPRYEKPVGKIKWLIFSHTEHKHERELVMKHEHITVADLKHGDRIYIALAYLRDDATSDIFAYFNRVLCGTLGCEMNIYRRQGKKLVPLLQDSDLLFMDIDWKGYQKEFGILPGKTMGRHDIAVYGDYVWKWDGREYKAAFRDGHQ